MDNDTCYGCRWLQSRWYGDGGTMYLCRRVPGLVVGWVSAFDNDEPQRCEEYEKPTEDTP